jgi:hypothetical protein
MPGGIANIGQSYLTFASIKLIGYSVAGIILNRAYKSASHTFLVVGITRTIIGLVLGAVFGIMFLPIFMLGPLGALIFLIALVPLRLLEWWTIIWLFYDRQTLQRGKDWRYVWYGTGWSFLLDIPAIIGIISVGGFWIC